MKNSTIKRKSLLPRHRSFTDSAGGCPVIHTLTRSFVAAFAAAALLACLAANPAGAATFSDDFDTGHDYLVDGVAGTGWDGLLLPTGANATVLDRAEATRLIASPQSANNTSPNWPSITFSGLMSR